MKSLTIIVFATFFSIGIFAASHALTGETLTFNKESARTPKKHLRPFTSETELKSFLKKIVKKRRGVGYGSGNGNGSSAGDVMPAAAESVDIAGSGKVESESITNTQHEGVDEGGIVKLHGEYLVVL